MPVPPDEAHARAHGVRAAFFAHASDGERLRTVAALLDDGLRVVVDRTSTIDEAPQALEHLAAGHARGKVIVVF